VVGFFFAFASRALWRLALWCLPFGGRGQLAKLEPANVSSTVPSFDCVKTNSPS
jgi:hypothetical protein